MAPALVHTIYSDWTRHSGYPQSTYHVIHGNELKPFLRFGNLAIVCGLLSTLYIITSRAAASTSAPMTSPKIWLWCSPWRPGMCVPFMMTYSRCVGVSPLVFLSSMQSVDGSRSWSSYKPADRQAAMLFTALIRFIAPIVSHLPKLHGDVVCYDVHHRRFR